MTAVVFDWNDKASIDPVRTHLQSAVDRLAQAASQPGDVALFDALRDAARGIGFDPPQLPEDLARVRRVLADSDAGPRELARAIRHNPVLGGQFIALANSAFFAGRHAVEHLEEAIVRVGMKTSVAWITALVAKAELFDATGFRHQAKEVFRHALAAAVNAQLIADSTRPALSAEAFTVGLMHDIGRVVVLAIAGDSERATGAPTPSTLVRASDELHAAFSALIARDWVFDDAVVAAIRDHHAVLDPIVDGESDALRLTRILQAADDLGHRMIDVIDVPVEPAPATIDLIGTFDTIDELLEDARTAFDAFDSAMN